MKTERLHLRDVGMEGLVIDHPTPYNLRDSIPGVFALLEKNTLLSLFMS